VLRDASATFPFYSSILPQDPSFPDACCINQLLWSFNVSVFVTIESEPVWAFLEDFFLRRSRISEPGSDQLTIFNIDERVFASTNFELSDELYHLRYGALRVDVSYEDDLVCFNILACLTGLP